VPSLRRHVSTGVLIALGVTLGGCGSGNSTAKPATTQLPGANPVAWVDVYCSGLAAVVDAQAQAAKMPSTAEGHKEGLLMVADTTEQAFANAAQRLTQLGPPAITNGTRAQQTMVGFFTTAAAAVGDRRAKLATLDANDPDFSHKADHQLAGPDLSTAATQMQELTTNKELASAFSTAPQCERLRATAAHQ
jgi:hypothetical protein